MGAVTKPGIYPQIEAEQYHAEICPAPALTSTTIKVLLRETPADAAYQHPAITPNSPAVATTRAKTFGDVGHQLALGKGRGYIISPHDEYRSNEAKAWKKDAIESGLTPIKQKEFEAAKASADIMVERINSTLQSIAKSRGLDFPGGVPYETEVVAVCEWQTKHGPVWARIMMDVWCEPLGVILDPKFSKQIARGTLEAQMTKMGWDTQGAFYPAVLAGVLPELSGKITFVNLVVHPDAPHRSRAVQMDEAWRYSSEIECQRATTIWAECLASGVFPSYPEGIETVQARNWTLKERMERELEDEEEE